MEDRLHSYPPPPCVGYFTSPGIDTRLWQIGTNGLISSERLGVKEIAKVCKRPQSDSNPGPLDRQSLALTTEPLRPTSSAFLSALLRPYLS